MGSFHAERLKKEVFNAYMLLLKYNLVAFAWGNVSGIGRSNELIVIKPSEIDFDRLTPEDIIVTDYYGVRLEGRYEPPPEMLTHIVLYKDFQL